MDEFGGDPRFAHVPKDPKFRRIPKNERKVKIDKRFQSMFKDKKFKITYTVDKRGRPIHKSSAEDLEKYYDLSSDSEEDKEDTETEGPKSKFAKENEKKVGQSVPKRDDSDQSEQSATNKESLKENERQLKLRMKNESNRLSNDIKRKLRDLTVDYARGEGVLLSDSSSDEVSSEDSEGEDECEDEGIEHMWGELDKEAETTSEVTSRLAACNMDWDRIRAVDLMVLFNSFLPSGGLIHSVTIYPSEFGLQRMKEEEMKGPIELSDMKDTGDQNEDGHDDGDGDDDEEGNEFRREKLRQYQLNRLKYYYAVIAFDCPESANKVYTECDGHEYESTATKLDLRFIPEEMEFDQEPKEVCDKLPDMSKYQPRQFTTTALQQVKVECTWDETQLDRQEITKRINTGKIDDIDENDLKAYLASGSSDEESESEVDQQQGEIGEGADGKNKDLIGKYKSLLKSIEQQEEEKKKKEGELEFTWGLGTKEKVEKLVSEKIKSSEMLTPFEQYLDKRKEKQKAKREKNKKKVREQAEQENQSNSESEDSIPSDVDIDNDPYFAEEFKNFKPRDNKKLDHRDQSNDEAQRKAELELLMLDKEDEQDKCHFDMKKIEEGQLLTKSKKKRLSKKKMEQKEGAAEDSFEVNVNDPRFSALFNSHHFNIDPADTHYRKTKGTEALIQEKLKRRANGEEISEELPAKQSRKEKEPQMNVDLAALVKSVKRNTNNISKRIK